MAIPTQQGGLNQVSKSPAPQAGNKFDAGAVQAENLETMNQSKSSDLRNIVSDELEDQRKALNDGLLRMRESLDTRKNRMFDPVLMQVAAGLLKPTKTGSFGESLGNAAESAGAASEREMLNEKENQKLEMELLGKEQELRRMMGSDRFMSSLLGGSGGAGGSAPAGGGAPAGGAVPAGGPKVAGAPPAGGIASTRPSAQQLLDAAKSGRINIDEQTLIYAGKLDPKLPAELRAILTIRNEKDRLSLDAKRIDATLRKVKLRGTDIERDMTNEEYEGYLKSYNEYADPKSPFYGDVERHTDYLDRNNLLDPSQIAGREPKAGGVKPPLPAPMTQAQRDALSEEFKSRAKSRSEAAELAGNELLNRGANSLNMENLAKDVLSLTESNAKAFNLMQNATVRDSLLRAIEQGASITAGPLTVAINLPARIALQGNKEYALTKEDITALQLFQQKQSAITAEMRKMARSPGEGATDKTEGQLYAAIGILPSDSARTLALKSEAMIQYARYNARAAELWGKFQDESPDKSFTYFKRNDADYKQLQKNYVDTLNDMREKNADMLRTSPKAPATAPNASGGSKPPANETPLQKFQREKKEREAQGKP